MLLERPAGHVDDHDRLVDAPADRGELRRSDRGGEDHVGAGLGVEREPREAVLEVARHPEGVGTRDDHELGRGPRFHRRLDTGGHRPGGAQRLRRARVLARAGVVLDVDRRDAGALERLHRAPDLRGIVEAALGIGDHRQLHGLRDGARACSTSASSERRPVS